MAPGNYKIEMSARNTHRESLHSDLTERCLVLSTLVSPSDMRFAICKDILAHVSCMYASRNLKGNVYLSLHLYRNKNRRKLKEEVEEEEEEEEGLVCKNTLCFPSSVLL